jgi:hypothetical protein
LTARESGEGLERLSLPGSVHVQGCAPGRAGTGGFRRGNSLILRKAGTAGASGPWRDPCYTAPGACPGDRHVARTYPVFPTRARKLERNNCESRRARREIKRRRWPDSGMVLQAFCAPQATARALSGGLAREGHAGPRQGRLSLGYLFVGGDQAYEGVERGFELYAPLVRKEGVIAWMTLSNIPRPQAVRLHNYGTRSNLSNVARR